VLDIGDVFINNEQNYEIKIKNNGDIPAQWSYMSSLTKFGNKFQFSPMEGYLKPKQTHVIAIKFESDVLVSSFCSLILSSSHPSFSSCILYVMHL
jgi:hypothetical protein